MRRSRIKAETSLSVIGMMSGTSLDGVDFAFCQFTRGILTQPGLSPWRYRLISCRTFEYPAYVIELIKRMQDINCTFLQYKQLEIQYTKFLIQILHLFTSHNKIQHYDLLSVHGHTIFHQPEHHITVQTTNLNYLAGQLKVDVCGNFRELDVFRGGQGAPLAPFGQEIFAGDAFINFGGIANVSYKSKGYDVNFCNLFLNHMTLKHWGKPFDKDGELGRSGTPNPQVMQYFMNNSAFKLGHSLAREQFQTFVKKTQETFPQNSFKPVDVLASYYQFLSQEITKTVAQLINQPKTTVLCTGGGAKNKFLLQLINQKSKFQFIVPNEELVDFKEAILFGFLGVKMLFGELNCEHGVGGNLVKGSVLRETKTSNCLQLKSSR